jgi:hypothetical protein
VAPKQSRNGAGKPLLGSEAAETAETGVRGGVPAAEAVGGAARCAYALIRRGGPAAASGQPRRIDRLGKCMNDKITSRTDGSVRDAFPSLMTVV